MADPGQALVWSTVRDLVVGSGLRFEDLGSRALKRAPEAWRLYGVLRAAPAFQER